MLRSYYGWFARSLAGVGATVLIMTVPTAAVASAADGGEAVDEAAAPATPEPVPVVERAPAPVSEAAPVSEPEEQPVPVSEPEEKPAPVSEPEEQPAPVSEPEEEPAPVSEPEGEPAPVSEPEEKPAPAPEEKPSKPSKPAEEDPAGKKPSKPSEPEEEQPEKKPSKPAEEEPAPAPEKKPSRPGVEEEQPAPERGSERPRRADGGGPRTPAVTAPAAGPPSAPWVRHGGTGVRPDLWSGAAGEALSAEWMSFLSLSGLEPSEYALDDIPAEMLDLYQSATLLCPGLPWTVLAGVGKVETDHGRNVAVSSAGARGPMQFLPSTWRQYGIDGNGDGRALIDDPVDAVHSAAGYLCDHGGGEPETLGEALYAYNHAWWYVERVLRYADEYRVAVPDDAEPGPVDRQALADNPRLVVYPGGRADIALGRIDPRVLDLLALLTQQHEITVVALQTGHSKYIAGTNRVSHHFHGRAVDIAAIDGEPVRRDSPRARALVLWLASLDGPQRPDEVGSPFADLEDQPGHFSNAAHLGHVHVGWGAARRP